MWALSEAPDMAIEPLSHGRCILWRCSAAQVTLVINYDVPMERFNREPNYDTYMHRIGRSGRFGRKGVAFNLIARPEVSQLSHIACLI